MGILWQWAGLGNLQMEFSCLRACKMSYWVIGALLTWILIFLVIRYYILPWTTIPTGSWAQLFKLHPAPHNPTYNSLISLARVSSEHGIFLVVSHAFNSWAIFPCPPTHAVLLQTPQISCRPHPQGQLLLTLWWFLLRLLFTMLHYRPCGVVVTFINSEYPGSSFLRQFAHILWKASRGRWDVPFCSNYFPSWRTDWSQPLLENGMFWLPRPGPVSRDSECAGISYCKYSKSSWTQKTEGRADPVPEHSCLTSLVLLFPHGPLLPVQVPCSPTFFHGAFTSFWSCFELI